MLETIHRYWNGKKLLLLVIFGLLAGNIVAYVCIRHSHQRIMTGIIKDHSRVFSAFKDAVDRHRKDSKIRGGRFTYWIALRETRKSFPGYDVSIFLPEVDVRRPDRSVASALQARPKGWRLTREEDGFASSYFSLPTKNVAALRVNTQVRREFREWQSLAILLGLYSGFVVMLFGWFWTRALAYSAKEVSGDRVEELSAGIQEILGEMAVVIQDLQLNANQLDHELTSGRARLSRAIWEAAFQIRIHAVNAALFLGKTSDNDGAGLLREIAKLAHLIQRASARNEVTPESLHIVRTGVGELAVLAERFVPNEPLVDLEPKASVTGR